MKTAPGIDRLLADPSAVAGLRVGLVTNPSGITASGVPTWKALRESRHVKLERLFGPEHGIDGRAIYMEAVENAVHPETGLPVV
ncbi:MAG TPA: exo-beta-N-acetylmuramidase NamZ domain-containing protein, partial [Thermoanaerobaculia bacterium]|nr:exo-beta-N-acetylmuramidase NamZ domain-containing protein [Thermoanaerobaculia bacterium]